MTKDANPDYTCSHLLRSKSAPPFGWVAPKELLVILLTGHRWFGLGANLQKELCYIDQSFEFISCTLDNPDAPPWLNSSFVASFNASLRNQVAIYSETLCSAQVALAMMSLQRGQETFIVIENANSLAPESILRIQQIGVPALSRKAFMKECAMAVHKA